MDPNIRFKEAFKVAFAFAIVYGIALKVNWMVPSWAGWSVVAVVASSKGQSIQKGVMRLLGTLLACSSAIVIIAISTQDRWIFVCLTVIWLFFTAYMMLAYKAYSYFWFIVAYVCLVILVVGPSPNGAFVIAVYRTLETAMGIVVYTLISVFIWPINNVGAVKKAAIDIMHSQVRIFQGAYEMITGIVPKDNLQELHKLEVQQIAQLNLALKTEGSESYEVQEILPLWDQFEKVSLHLRSTKENLMEGIKGLQKLEIPRLLPDLDHFFKEINHRFSEAASLLAGNQPSIKLQESMVIIDNEAAEGISHLEKTGLAIVIDELNNIDEDSRTIVSIAMEIAGFQDATGKILNKDILYKSNSGFKFHVPDFENLKGALYVALVIFFGFLIWFYINPPGHSMWYIMSGIFALLFAPMQPLRLTRLIIPFLIAMFVSSLIYVFILPELTNFFQLSILLFTCLFIIRYYLSGVLMLVFTIAVIQIISISNPQKYDVSGLLNGFVYIPMIMMYLFCMSYIISSPRPEKKLSRLVKRFLKSAGYLISKNAFYSEKQPSFVYRYKSEFYLQELENLPGKINKWGMAIDHKLFPGKDYAQIAYLVNTLELLVTRIHALMESNGKSSQNKHLVKLNDDLAGWKEELAKNFENWNIDDDQWVRNSEAVKKSILYLKETVEQTLSQNKISLNEKEGIQFYQYLGNFHEVTEATLAFAGALDKVPWQQYHEERFE